MIFTVNGGATTGNRNSQSKRCQIPAGQVRLTANAMRAIRNSPVLGTDHVEDLLNSRYPASRTSAPMTAITKLRRSKPVISLYPSCRATKPPMTAPTTPIMIVIMTPPGSSHGMMSFANAPAILGGESLSAYQAMTELPLRIPLRRKTGREPNVSVGNGKNHCVYERR
jgi:hypothetical protein